MFFKPLKLSVWSLCGLIAFFRNDRALKLSTSMAFGALNVRLRNLVSYSNLFDHQTVFVALFIWNTGTTKSELIHKPDNFPSSRCPCKMRQLVHAANRWANLRSSPPMFPRIRAELRRWQDLEGWRWLDRVTVWEYDSMTVWHGSSTTGCLSMLVRRRVLCLGPGEGWRGLGGLMWRAMVSLSNESVLWSTWACTCMMTWKGEHMPMTSLRNVRVGFLSCFDTHLFSIFTVARLCVPLSLFHT